MERRLNSLFPSLMLEDHAEEVGLVERNRKLQMPPLVWSLVFGFATGESRSLADFRRSYNSTADDTLCPSGFYQQLTPELAEYLSDLVEAALDEVTVPDTTSREIDRFRDIISADGTVLRLHELLADDFEGRKEEQTGARLHLLHNITEQTIDDYSVTDEKTHDSTQFDTGPWLEDRLVLFGRAYLSYRRFALIDENGGYFVTPLKDNAKPVITEELREWRGDAIPLEGEQIHDVTEDLYRQYIDVEVEVEFERRAYAGEQSEDSKRFRVVGVRDEGADDRDYELYITNVPREEFLPDELATIYSCRWETELLFRELKTQYELDEFDTIKKHVVEILLYAAILSLLVSQELLALLTEHASAEIVFPPERWAATLRSHAQLLLYRLGDYLGYSPPPLLDRLVKEAQKIHQERQTLQEELVTAMQPTAEA
ncbi:IS4 family transposase [Halalkaliarchaeum desulfuricum]|nr:IS4 family transposase [Halalkaliarchaeum desulfuricum]